MAKNLISKKNKMIKIKTAMEKLQRSLQLGKRSPTSSTTTSDVEDYQVEEVYNANDSSTWVPEDVKEGHFAVVAIDKEYELAKRFVVPLKCLANPTFVALLERAAEEYGFDHRGALTIPCGLNEMEMILAERRQEKQCSRKVNRIMRNPNFLLFA